jgi:hypothetical protein
MGAGAKIGLQKTSIGHDSVELVSQSGAKDAE